MAGSMSSLHQEFDNWRDVEKKMKNNFKWNKELIDGKWYSVCDHEHVPMIEHTRDDKYKVRNCNGKAILHQDFASAEKLAIETYKKFEKFNKSFEG